MTTTFTPPPPMAARWPNCCGKPMWFGPHGYGCSTCRAGKQRPVVDVELPDGQLELFAPGAVA